MVCTIADNKPLQNLRSSLGIAKKCHSWRKRCVHGLAAPQSDFVLGAPGAALGYCQALFSREQCPEAHTVKVGKLLEQIDAPWAKSHELYWGYRRNESIPDYLHRGITPLLGSGRVPILISSLDPARDLVAIMDLVSTAPPIPDGETILLRLLLRDSASVECAAHLVRELFSQSCRVGKMPAWWPLFQGALPVEVWRQFKELAEDVWGFVNVAVNPFVSKEVLGLLAGQITVAQVVLGLAQGVHEDGVVTLPKRMAIVGAQEEASYDLPEFIHALATLRVVPTMIVLGPAQDDWPDSVNQERIIKLLPLLHEACGVLWRPIGENRAKELLRYKA